MKKLLLLIMVAFAAIACEGPMGPEGPEGPMGPPGEMAIYVNKYTIKANQWTIETTEEGFVYYTCEVRDENLYQEFYDEGTVTGYIYLKNEAKTLLPYTENYVDNEGYSYIENYTFEYSSGKIIFIIKTNSPDPLPPLDCTFQIAIMY